MDCRLRRTVLAIVLGATLLFSALRLGVAAYPEEGQVAIVFDMSHDQPLSYAKRNFTMAIDFFLEHSEFFPRIHSSGEINATTLARARILVIPNPGRNFSTQELKVVADFVAAGGALFLLCDYQTGDRAIGNPEALNQILAAISEDRIWFTTYREGNETQGDAIVDLANNITLAYNIFIEGTTITAETREMIGYGVKRVIIAGGSLTTSSEGLVVSRGANTSRAVAINGQVIQDRPPWLAAFWIGEARIVLCTSTTMFSDTRCAGLNESWFQCEDNALLWYNIFKWLARPLIHNPTPIMVVMVAVVLLVGVGLLGYTLWQKRKEHG